MHESTYEEDVYGRMLKKIALVESVIHPKSQMCVERVRREKQCCRAFPNSLTYEFSLVVVISAKCPIG